MPAGANRLITALQAVRDRVRAGRRVPRLAERAPALIAECETRIEQSVAYAHEHFEDQPEIRDWVWTD